MTEAETKLIDLIATKARRIAIVKNKFYPEKATLVEDLTKVHEKIGLDLHKLFNADMTVIAHDVCGIYRHIDHDTGDLRDGFLPRCVK